MKQTEILKALGARWKSASDGEKAPFVSAAAAEKAKRDALPPAPAPSGVSGAIKIKDDAALERLVANVADAAVKGFLSEVACASAGNEEKEFVISGAGKVRVSAREGKKPIAVTYRPPRGW